MLHLRPGTLLVASAGLRDGIFDDGVVLLLDRDDNGALGVLINHLSTLTIDSVLPHWADLVSQPRALFSGGPVSREGAICLAAPNRPDEEPPGWRRLFGDVGLLHLDTPVEIAAGAYRRLRIFAGYAGWSAGQLEHEIHAGMWFPVSAHFDDVFDTEPGTLWRRILRRQGGDLAVLASWTAQPEWN